MTIDTTEAEFIERHEPLEAGIVGEGSQAMVIAEIEPARYTPAKTLGGIPNLADFVMLSERICKTAMVPAPLRGKPDEVLAVVLYGAELGLGPMQSLNSIDFIQGKPEMSAEGKRALVQKAGHQIVPGDDGTDGWVDCHRLDWPADKWERVFFTSEDAKAAGLLNKDNWKQHKPDMLVARATSRGCRRHFADVIAGLSYIAEEIESFTPAPPTVTRPSPLVVESDIRLIEPPPASPDGEVMMSPAQAKKIHAMLRDAGIPEAPREVRLEYMSAVLKRPVTTSKNLTGDEASRLIEALQLELDGDPGPEPDDV